MDINGDVGGSKYSYSGCLADPCIASSSPSDNGSDGNFYCVNGGEIGGSWNEVASFCTCTLCDTYYSGTHCEIDGSCQATTEPTDDDLTETFTASMEGRLAECLGLARALLAMTMLEVQTVLPAQKATVGMPPGVSLIV